MLFGTIGNVRDLIEVFISAASVLGGAMAFYSGSEAAESVAERAPEVLAHRINRGLARGFIVGSCLAGIVAILLIG